MGAPGVAAHTLQPGSTLKRGKVYIYDAMNLLYSLLSIAAVSDLLSQCPAVPTRELVSSLSLDLSLPLSSHLSHTHSLTQVWDYLDRWCAVHKFDSFVKRGKKQAPIGVLFTLDGFTDPTKMTRNHMHKDRQNVHNAHTCTYTHIHTYTHTHTHIATHACAYTYTQELERLRLRFTTCGKDYDPADLKR